MQVGKFRFLLRWVIGFGLDFVGIIGIPESKTSMEYLIDSFNDSWILRALFVVLGTAIITYPQWRNHVWPQYPDGSRMPLLFRLSFWWTSKKIQWERRRKQK